MLDLGDLVGRIVIDDSRADSVLAGFPAKIQGMGAAGAVAGAAVAVGVGAALSQGIVDAVDAEAAVDKVGAQLGLTETESARIGASAGRLYRDAYGESIEDVATSVGIVISSIDGMRGATDTAVEAMTAKLMNLSSAFGVDVGRAAQVAGQAVKSGLAADADEAVDLLTSSFQKVPANLREDLMDAVDEYGPFLNAVGITGADAFGLLAKGADKGMYGIDKAGDAVKEFSIRSTDMSAASKVAFDILGTSQGDFANKMLQGGDVASEAFGQIVSDIGDIQDPVARSQAALALFGTPLEDLSVDQIPTFLDSLWDTSDGLENVAGSADRMGETLAGNAKTGWVELQRSFESIMTGIGASLLPFLQGFLDWANSSPEAMSAVAVILGVLAVAFVGLSIATWAANAAFLASPITWIILGIVALVAAIVWLVMNWESVTAFITEIWGGFIGWLGEVMDGFLGWWNGLWTGIWEWIVSVWNGMVSWITEVWNGFIGFLVATGQGIADWWNGLWAGIGQFIQDVWQAFVGFVIGVFVGYYNTLVGIGGTLVGWWNGLWTAVGDFLRGLWSSVTSWASSVWDGMVSTFRAVGDGLASWWNGLWNGIVSGIQGAVGFVGDAVNNFIAFFTGIQQQVTSALADAGQWLWDAGVNLVQGLIDGVSSMVGGLIDTVVGGVNDAVQGAKNLLGIASPSKLFYGFGINTVEGMILGIEKLTPDLQQKMEELVTVAPADMTLRALPGAEERLRADVAAGKRIEANQYITIGNVGWSADEATRQFSRKLQDSIDEIQGELVTIQ